jgi:hypothetical protein
MQSTSKVLAVTLLAAASFSLGGFASAAPINTGLGLKDAVTSDVVSVAYRGGVGRVGVGRVGVGRVGVGRVGVGRVGVGGGRYVGAGRWAGGWRRPGYGLAAGAVVGGALAAGSYYGGYGYNDSYGSDYNNTGYGYDSGYNNGNFGYSSYGYDQNNYASYCAQRFRSYDPSTGTYLGYDGIRHSCP